jgi:hypothetical protein
MSANDSKSSTTERSYLISTKWQEQAAGVATVHETGGVDGKLSTMQTFRNHFRTVPPYFEGATHV